MCCIPDPGQHTGEGIKNTMAFSSDKEEQQFCNRLRDLANKSYQQNIYTFSAFLGLSEISVYEQMKKEISDIVSRYFEISPDKYEIKVILIPKSE